MTLTATIAVSGSSGNTRSSVFAIKCILDRLLFPSVKTSDGGGERDVLVRDIEHEQLPFQGQEDDEVVVKNQEPLLLIFHFPFRFSLKLYPFSGGLVLLMYPQGQNNTCQT